MIADLIVWLAKLIGLEVEEVTFYPSGEFPIDALGGL